ncbi:MAG: nucleoside deaminase [Bryobacterales bacterium]|nr:nucleoside deaminase [Bryobacterales bacterium]
MHLQIIIRLVNPAFLERAIALAIENVLAGGGPFGAVIVRDGKILAEGVNMVISTNDPTAHAEVTAIRNASRALNAFHMPGCEIYSSCEPCPMCLGAIYWAHLDRVYFAATQQEASQSEFDDTFIYRQIALPPESRLIPMIHVPSGGRALAPFQAWMEKEDRIRY